MAKKAALDNRFQRLSCIWEREEVLHISSDGRFPEDSAAEPAALPEDTVPVPVAEVEVGGALGAGCSVTFEDEVLGASGKYDSTGASAWGAYARTGAIAGGEAAGGFVAG